MSYETMKIAIILGSTRAGRVSPSVGKWYQEIALKNTNAQFDILDLKDFQLPFLGESSDMEPIQRWNQALANYDGFVFITPEYNHSIPAVLKNALDSAKDVWNNKAAAIVSYGSAGGSRAAEHLRGILGELQIADVRQHIVLTLFNDFENFKVFKPLNVHEQNIKVQLEQLLRWASALKQTR